MIYLKGFWLGMILQLSVGPVFFGVIQRSISIGYLEAAKMIAGVVLVDFFYLLVSFSSITVLLKISLFRLLLKTAGAMILIYFGIVYIKKAHPEGERTNNNQSSFIYGIKLTLSNPLTILFWTGIFSTLISSGTLEGTLDIVCYSLGCLSATVLFLNTAAITGNSLIGVINDKILRYFNYAVGLFFIGFALLMLVQ